MASNKIFNFGPVALTATLTTNILNTAPTSLAGTTGFTLTQPYVLIRHIRITNKTAGAVSFSLWKGATGGNAAGTEFIGTGQSIAANSSYDYFSTSGVRFDSTDFLVGGASAATSLTIQGEGEIGFI